MTTENGEPTIILGSGGLYDYRCPEDAVATIEDLAYGQASAARFAGQAILRSTGRRVVYNVAEHCVRMVPFARPEIRYSVLMHEAGEGVCLDMNSPLKGLCPDYKAIEKRCERAEHIRFNVPMTPEIRAEIKVLDLRMCVTEKLYLRPRKWTDRAEAADQAWNGRYQPLDVEIVEPWSFEVAAAAFLDLFWTLAPPEIVARERAIIDRSLA
jgi:uncharacterized protein